MNSLLPDSDSEDDLPQGWEQKVSLTNRVYYLNNKTKTTQWNHPISGKKKAVSGKLPEGWQRKFDEDGNHVLYYNINTHQATYTDPRLGSAFEVMDYRGIPAMARNKELGPNSTTEDVLEKADLSGEIAIVTGANSGIGFETAKSLALHGAHVIMACRDSSKAHQAIDKIRSCKEEAKLTFLKCDLSSLSSVKQCCDLFSKMNLKLDILILNAAVNELPYTLTENGIETTFQVNHLGHFYMVRLLEKKLIQSSTRIVFVSSESHRFSTLNKENVDQDWSPSNFISFMAYNDSKLCNILTAQYLHRRLCKHNVTVVSCHPGNLVYTNLQRYWWLLRVLYFLFSPFTKSANQGASTVIFCAVTDEIRDIGGLYFNNCQECEPSEKAQDSELADLLADKSNRMIDFAMNFESK
ncbi:short chain dehydrogenase-like protein [Dermatophagoides farinae]|uniref:WW domain-containing oxidoreductase n=1 Tax=Dermatophagoides farinae TaxID=6954 RepID=A0A9D4P011_DERFA|nr:WW domain-containing oxidoreductase-like [Dermatophagoides farinae]KAH7642251.1 short chain dehydrogenase-like protein [Dermatophagoides farinae]